MEAADAKPLDLGSGRVCASFDLRSAAWLSIGGPHPTHGFVELSALPSFEETGRGDPTATRQHRLAMTRPDHAFLRVELDGGLPELTPDPRDPGAPRWTSDLVEVRATTEPDALTIRQAWSVAARSDARPSVAIRLRGALDQPALAEITELDPPRPTGAISSFALGEAAVTITASALPAEAAVTVRGARVTWTSADGEMLGTVAWPDGETRLDLILSVALSGLTRPADPNCALGSDDDDPIVARALTYIRGCTALLPGSAALGPASARRTRPGRGLSATSRRGCERGSWASRPRWKRASAASTRSHSSTACCPRLTRRPPTATGASVTGSRGRAPRSRPSCFSIAAGAWRSASQRGALARIDA